MRLGGWLPAAPDRLATESVLKCITVVAIGIVVVWHGYKERINTACRSGCHTWRGCIVGQHNVGDLNWIWPIHLII